MNHRSGAKTAAAIDLAAVATALREVCARFIELEKSAPNPGTRVPSTPAWTVRDVLAHLVTVVPRYAVGPEGGGRWVDTPVDLPDLNAEQLAGTGGQTIAQLCERLTEEVESLIKQVHRYGSEAPTYRFHGGGAVGADVALGILLGELVIHGWDVANALGKPWKIDAAHVGLIVTGLIPIIPGWLNPTAVRGLQARCEIRIRGVAAYSWAFRDGSIQIENGSRPPFDVHISADPEAFLLVFYRRRSFWPYVLTGRLLAWGRRPWLALTLPGRFHRP